MKKVFSKTLFLVVFFVAGSFLFADDYALPDVDDKFIGTYIKTVQEWLNQNEEKAYAAWNLAVQNKHFDKID